MSTLLAYEPAAANIEHSNNGVQFAYQPINITNGAQRGYLDTVSRVSRYSMSDAWRFYDEIGEVHYALDRTAAVAGYANLFPQRINARGQATDAREDGVLADIVSGIYGKFGGVRGLIERFDTLMRVTGEAFLIRVVEDGIADGYWLLSPDEIQPPSITASPNQEDGPIQWITASVTGSGGDTSKFTREVAPEDFLGRIWMPSKRYVDMTNSPLLSLRPLCEELIDLTKSIHGRLRQRFALAGLLLIPSGINDANIAGPRPGQDHSDKVMDFLITLMTRNVMDHDQAYAHIPGILKGPAAELSEVRHMILDTAIASGDIEQRSELIGRILQGLDVQKQQSQSNEGSNHWSAWSNSEDERRVAVQPKLEAFCHAVTRAILRKELKQNNWIDAKIAPWRVWYDLSEATTQINQAENFRLGWERGWIDDEAGRRSIGAAETDKMTPEDKVRWAGYVTKDPYLMSYGIDGKDGIAIDWDKVGASQKAPGPAADAGGGKGEPGSPAGRDSDAPKSKEPR